MKRPIKISQHVLGFTGIWIPLASVESVPPECGNSEALMLSTGYCLMPVLLGWDILAPQHTQVGAHIPSQDVSHLLSTCLCYMVFTLSVSECGTPLMTRFAHLRHGLIYLSQLGRALMFWVLGNAPQTNWRLDSQSLLYCSNLLSNRGGQRSWLPPNFNTSSLNFSKRVLGVPLNWVLWEMCNEGGQNYEKNWARSFKKCVEWRKSLKLDWWGASGRTVVKPFFFLFTSV